MPANCQLPSSNQSNNHSLMKHSFIQSINKSTIIMRISMYYILIHFEKWLHNRCCQQIPSNIIKHNWSHTGFNECIKQWESDRGVRGGKSKCSTVCSPGCSSIFLEVLQKCGGCSHWSQMCARWSEPLVEYNRLQEFCISPLGEWLEQRSNHSPNGLKEPFAPATASAVCSLCMKIGACPYCKASFRSSGT